MSTVPNPLPTDAEIIARFHALRITIGLSYSQFGYASTGVPDQIKRIERGVKLHTKSRERIAYCLDELEKGHSIPMPIGKREHNENIIDLSVASKDNNPIVPRTEILDTENLEE